jgi:nitroreductase
MDVYEAIGRRKTIRDFAQRAVDRESIKKILEAGMAAPTNDHLRNWEYIVVEERKSVEKSLKAY